jgi:hypothetical protein
MNSYETAKRLSGSNQEGKPKSIAGPIISGADVSGGFRPMLG